MLLRNNDTIYRVLDSDEDKLFVIDCIKKTMPKWVDEPPGFTEITEKNLLEITGVNSVNLADLAPNEANIVHKRFTLISPVLTVVSDDKQRSKVIRSVSASSGVSKQTIRHYLCTYLVFQNKAMLAPKTIKVESKLTPDEKNMRWALNKFFYTSAKNSLNTAYRLMIREKYCGEYGKFADSYPTFHQFRYFYRKTKKLQTFYISRDGKKDYQRNHRPLLGDGVQQYAKSIGMGMLDSTVCDIYLINEFGELVGRPILTACIDAYSGLCNGYCLTWEGGVYSLRGLMINVLSDKMEHCKKFGISIEKEQWNSSKLPATLVTDMGSEYKSENFEQIAELGVTLINLPPYRPELKGMVEKFFDLIQSSYKPYLKGKGVIEPDYQERGAHDYRKDACLTLEDFEKVIIKCIIYYNNSRIIENFPYTNEMLSVGVRPNSASIWNWGLTQESANLIDVSADKIIQTLLPRTIGKFSRTGLIVNKLRYKNENYVEKYLSGGTAMVAYNPKDVSYVWLIDNGSYQKFELIESRFVGDSLAQVNSLQDSCKSMISKSSEDNLRAQIELAGFIETIANNASKHDDVNLQGIRKTRKKEHSKTHIDYMNGGEPDE